MNFIYLLVLPLWGEPYSMTSVGRGIQYASEDRVATAVMQQIMGQSGAKLMALAILVSTFGCNNGLDSGWLARILRHGQGRTILRLGRQAASAFQDSTPFSHGAGGVGQRTVPERKLRSVTRLYNFCGPALLCAYLGGICLFCAARVPMRRDRIAPWDYPWLPAIYIVMALFIDIVLLLYKPQYTWPGLVIVLLGIPVYFLWSRNGVQTPAAVAPTE